MGFDACIDYREAGCAKRSPPPAPMVWMSISTMSAARSSNHALNFMNEKGRVVCCGAISQYDTDTPSGPRNLPGVIVVKRLKMEGFIVMDFAHNDAKCVRAMQHWVGTGQIKVHEDIVEGLEKRSRRFDRPSGR